MSSVDRISKGLQEEWRKNSRLLILSSFTFLEFNQVLFLDERLSGHLHFLGV